jgi:Fe-S-cluster containining protein
MELSEDDVKRLVNAGYTPEDFIVVRDGIPRLKNVDGWCYFFNPSEKLCRVYPFRPLGCRLYPVVYVEGEGVTLDELCPARLTVSPKEFRVKAKALNALLERINRERETRQKRT